MKNLYQEAKPHDCSTTTFMLGFKSVARDLYKYGTMTMWFLVQVFLWLSYASCGLYTLAALFSWCRGFPVNPAHMLGVYIFLPATFIIGLVYFIDYCCRRGHAEIKSSPDNK